MCHLPRRLVLVLAFVVIACGGGGSGSDSGSSGNGGEERRALLVRWRAASEAAGYVIHWGPASGVYTQALDVGLAEQDADGVVSHLVDDIGVAGTIHFAMTSYDESGRMSAFSNELVVVVP